MRVIELIICLIFLSNLEVKSQNYFPFPTDSATWTEATQWIALGYNPWLPVEYKMSGDTLISGLTYSKIQMNLIDHPYGSSGEYYIGGLREDENKKVYFRPDSIVVDADIAFYYVLPFLFPSDSTEYLLYDFSQIEVGDTLVDYYNPNPNDFDIVSGIDSTLVGDEYRKVYEFTNSFLSFPTSFFIEGIGSSLGLFAPFGNPFAPEVSGYQLTCFSHGDVFFENPYEFEVSDCQVIVSVQEFRSSSFSLYPNPTSDKLLIESSGSRIQSVQIYSQSGKLVYSDMESRSKSLELDLSMLESGLYFVQIIDASESFTEKLVKR
ncbi:MAG: T9SS type A sorting domain-containing protein [Flavobacteriales bacterium]